MKGAVLTIGSLLWETKENALKEEQGIKRKNWREKLDIGNKIEVKIPIRYGRKSSSRRCTYTMVFSNSVDSLGTAFLVPYLEDIDNFTQLRKQAVDLAEAEGISTDKYSNRLIASWGSIGIKFNPNRELQELSKNWSKEFSNFKNDGYRIGDELPSITTNGELNFNIKIPHEIDYVLATPLKPELSEYPTIERVAQAIQESDPKYDTYLIENYNNGIRVERDEELIELIN